MSRKLVSVISLLMLASVLAGGALAQMQQRGRQFGGPGWGNCACTGSGNFDLANKATIEGTVESVHMGPGQGFPTFTLVQADGKKSTIVASPYRALADAEFKIAIGDRMSVVAFPSLQYEGTFLATELKNLTNNTVLKLRDESGVPVGAPQGSRGYCRGFGPGGI